MKESHDNRTGGTTGQEGGSDPNAISLNSLIVESINHALVVLDSEFRAVRFNSRFLDMFRIRSLDDPRFSLSDVIPDSELESVIRQSVSEGDSMHEIEFSSRIGDEDRHFLISTSRIDLSRLENGSLVLVTFNEVTEWKQHQAQVMEASRLVSIGEMAAGIAHEVNNPLAAVMGFTQLAMRRNQDSSVARDLDKILSETKRASKIITNLQSFARRYKPAKKDVNVASIVQNVLDFRRYELDVNNVSVQTNLGADIPFVPGDEHQLEQVILNMVINAEYFMFNANGSGTLSIETAYENGKVWLSFADDGPGIARENLPKIFDPFFTTKEVGKGTGLGLSICYGIVHEHDGVITVESTEGKGTTFTIELPASQQGETISSPHASSGSSEPRAGMNVLIVDDEPGVAEVVSRALTENGHTVDVVENGSEVVQRENLNDYDLFILDVKMPGIGGAALYDHIASVSKELSSRVMFITGDTTNPGTKEFIDSTSSPLLTKPFTIENLMSRVNRFTSTWSPAHSEDSE